MYLSIQNTELLTLWQDLLKTLFSSGPVLKLYWIALGSNHNSKLEIFGKLSQQGEVSSFVNHFLTVKLGSGFYNGQRGGPDINKSSQGSREIGINIRIVLANNKKHLNWYWNWIAEKKFTENVIGLALKSKRLFWSTLI